MGAVLLVAGSQLRRRWPALISVALLIGIAGATVLACLAGARRTASAVDRFMAETDAADLQVYVEPIGVDVGALVPTVAAMPDVELVTPQRAYLIDIGTDFDFAVLASEDPRVLTEIDRPRILEGRMPQTAVEIALNERAAADLGVRVGDSVGGATFTPAEHAAVFGAGGESTMGGPRLELEVVGVYRLAHSLPDNPREVDPEGIAAPAFDRRYAGTVGAFDLALVRLRAGADHGAVGLRIADAVEAAIPGTDVFAYLYAEGVRVITADGARVTVVGLVLFAGVAFLASAVFVGQALSRQIGAAALDTGGLGALGCTRRTHASALTFAVLPAAAGVVLAGVLAAVASIVFPFGLAGRAEPAPGPTVDWTVLAPGVGVLLALVIAWAGAMSWRLANAQPTSPRRPRSATLAVAFGRAGAPAGVVAGARLAFERGAGRNALPVRSAVAGTVIGIAGVVAALVFAQSATRLVGSPDRWGATWDLGPMEFEGILDAIPATASAAIERENGIEAAAVLEEKFIDIGGINLAAISIDSLRGDMALSVVEGRPPITTTEIALGASSLDALGVEVGDQVEIAPTGGGESVQVRVVGRAVLPVLSSDGPGEGVAVTPEALDEYGLQTGSAGLVVRFAAGADRTAIGERLAAVGFRVDAFANVTPPAPVANLHEVRAMPWALAGFFGLLGAAGLAHAVSVGARRRRRELAVLEALGFVRRQIRAAVRWQAILTIAVGALIGVPLGLIAGRWLWALVADGIGVAGDPAVPVSLLAGVVAAAGAAAVAIAVVPGWVATRQTPGVVLRTE